MLQNNSRRKSARGRRILEPKIVHRRWLKTAAYLAILASFLSLTESGFTNPKDGQVVSGSATIGATSPSTLQVDQHTKIVIIDWSSFNIAGGETTKFNQPSASAMAVNRIGGGDPSRILGSLLANGRIVLINGDGIVFGPNARIDVGALLATTSDASNADIASGKATFDKAGNPHAMIVNQGSIDARSGLVGLIAPAVRNDGIVTARLGSVTLGASNVFTVDFTGDGLISFPLDANVVSRAIDANGKPVEALVVNNGKIIGSTVLLSARAARDLVTNVVSAGGTIAATSVRQEGKKVVLDGGDGGVLVNGTITAVGRTGGEISINGGDITLSHATLDASGKRGGGTINVGDWSAKSVTVDSATTLLASATQNGNGGSISVISAQTQFAGEADARGGPNGGNGGSVETSGHSLNIAGAKVDTSALLGVAGNWLLDPDDYTIDASAASTIEDNLASGNVIIATTASGTGGNGDIFVNSAVSWASSNMLTLSAYHNIEVNAPITVSGAGQVVFMTNTGGTGGNLSFGLGPNGFAGSLSFTGTPNTGQSLTINGTPYKLLYSMSDVQNINASNTTLAGKYALANSLDASAVSGWVPIGTDGAGNILNSGNGFAGIFDGLGKTVSNLTISLPSANYVGLFGYVGTGGTIRNVGLLDASVTGNSSVGGLVGWNDGGTISNAHATGLISGSGYWVGGLVGQNDGAITQSYATGAVNGTGNGVGGLAGYNGGTITDSYATGVVSGGNWVGGLVGWNDSGTITQSYATGAVSGSYDVGGLVGENNWGGTITASYATGAVTGSGSVGGLVGWSGGTITQSYATGAVSGTNEVGGLVGQSSGTITQSYATGAVSGSYDVGGLVGENNWGGTITQSYATGAVSGGYYVGGLVGRNGGTITQSYATGAVSGTNEVGGLVGVSYNGTVTQSYATGAVSGTNEVGGLVGENYGGTITQSYATSTVSGTNEVGGLVGFNFGSGLPNGSSRSSIRLSYATGTVSGTNYVGGLAGTNTNSTITQSYATGAVSGGNYVGGLAGTNTGGSITQSYATGAVSGGNYVGGLVGTNTNSEFSVGWINGFGTITQSYATGAVNGFYAVGGLVGYNFGAITQSYAAGAVNGTSAHVGGLVGYNFGTITRSYATGAVGGGILPWGDSAVGGLVGANDGGTITRSYATGAVSAPGHEVGGLVGANYGSIEQSYETGAVNGSDELGGLVGRNAGPITQSYATGAVNGNGSSVGGLVGFAGAGSAHPSYQSTIAQSYWDTQSTGQSNGVGTGDASGTTGLTSAEARTQSSYVGWDFAGTWFMIDGETRPFLRWEYSTTITNAHQLQLMAMDLTASYTLANDIDLGPALAADAHGNYPGMWGSSGFVPIGNNPSLFAGTLDGEGHTISNLKINRPSDWDVGLFGVVGTGGTVRNVGLLDESVTGDSEVGGLVGVNEGTIERSYATGVVSGTGRWVGGLVGVNNGTITQSYTTGAVSGGYYVGGLVGRNGGTITQSYATRTVGGRGNGEYGGLVGYNSGTITQSYATGAVSAPGNEVGGLVGANYGSIEQSYATGAVSGGFYNGGLVGGNFGTITQSYATGAVSGHTSTPVGGLVGGNFGTITQSYATGTVSSQWSSPTGGLVGWNYGGTITQSYATGAVNGNDIWVGGLVGGIRGGTITQSYWDTQSSGRSNGVGSCCDASGVTGLTTAQLSNGTLPSGFNPATWVAHSHYYPCLLWQASCIPSIIPITYSIGNTSSTYGTLATLGVVTLTGVLAEDTENVSGTVTAYDGSNNPVTFAATTNAGTYTEKVTSLTGSAASYYTIAATGNTDGILIINPAPLIVAVNNASRTYGDANPAFSATITGFVLGQDSSVLSGLTLSTAATASSNVGGYAITSSGGTATNYVIASRTDGTLTVAARPITVAADNLSRLYGDTNPTLTYSVTSGTLVNGDTLSGALATLAMAASDIGSYAITQGTLAASSNYALSFNPGTLTINPAQLTVAVNDASRTYGDANPSFGATITGFKLSDTAAVVTGLTYSTAATPSSNVGSYAITSTGGTAANYVIASRTDGTLTINPAQLTVAANNASRTYGDANPMLTGVITGFKLSDTASIVTGLTYSTAATQSSNVGAYAITSSGGTATNYVIASRTNGTLTINRAPLTVAVNNASRTYGDANPAFSATITGFVLGQDRSVLSGLTFATSATQSSGIGTYAITSSGGTAANYVIVNRINGTLAVVPRFGWNNSVVIAALRLEEDLGNDCDHAIRPFCHRFDQIDIGNLLIANDDYLACILAPDLLECRSRAGRQ